LFVAHHHKSVSQTLLELRAAAPADPVQAYTGMVDYYAAAERYLRFMGSRLGLHLPKP